MSSDTTYFLHLWYFQFFISMGGVLSAAIPLAIGVLFTHWLYVCARGIEAKPTPTSFPKTILKLSGFQALVAGAALVPVSAIGSFYLLFNLLWKFAPAMPPSSSTAVPHLNAPFPAFDSGSADEWFSSMASLIIYLAVLTAIICAIFFFLLRNYARRIDAEKTLTGIIKKVMRRYFHESILVGFLLVLTASPVILIFIYNMAWLVMFIDPSTAQALSKIAFADSEHLYFRSLEVIGSWLILVLFLPSFLLLARGLRLRIRYTIENPTMNLIFKRSFKFFSLGLFGYVGVTLMQYLAGSFFKIIIHVSFR